MRVYITEQADKKCGGCNWQAEYCYGIGDNIKHARSHYEKDKSYGRGLCSHCLIDLLVNENYNIGG